MDAPERPPPRRFIDPWNFERPPGHSGSSVVCPSCPRPGRRIPYRLFVMPHDARAHLRRFTSHELAFWCDEHERLEEVSVTSQWEPQKYGAMDPLVRGQAFGERDERTVLEAAIDWRRGEILRIEREVEALQVMLDVRLGRHQEAV